MAIWWLCFGYGFNDTQISSPIIRKSGDIGVGWTNCWAQSTPDRLASIQAKSRWRYLGWNKRWRYFAFIIRTTCNPNRWR
jgi:hypothetical protein